MHFILKLYGLLNIIIVVKLILIFTNEKLRFIRNQNNFFKSKLINNLHSP